MINPTYPPRSFTKTSDIWHPSSEGWFQSSILCWFLLSTAWKSSTGSILSIKWPSYWAKNKQISRDITLLKRKIKSWQESTSKLTTKSWATKLSRTIRRIFRLFKSILRPTQRISRSSRIPTLKILRQSRLPTRVNWSQLRTLTRMTLRCSSLNWTFSRKTPWLSAKWLRIKIRSSRKWSLRSSNRPNRSRIWNKTWLTFKRNAID